MPVDRLTAALAVLMAALLAILVTNPVTSVRASGSAVGAIEYKVVRLAPQFTGNSEATLNQMGAQGWDIAYGVGEYLVMKRHK